MSFPVEERYGMITQIRRAALSVHLNIAGGCSRKSETERKRFYEKARGSIIEIDKSPRYCKWPDLFEKYEYLYIGRKNDKMF